MEKRGGPLMSLCITCWQYLRKHYLIWFGHPTSDWHFLCNLPPFPCCFMWNSPTLALCCLILPKAISSDGSKQHSFIYRVHACQRKGLNLGFLHRSCSVPDYEHKDISKTVLVVPEIFLISKESLASNALMCWTNKCLSSFRLIFVVCKLFLRYT